MSIAQKADALEERRRWIDQLAGIALRTLRRREARRTSQPQMIKDQTRMARPEALTCIEQSSFSLFPGHGQQRVRLGPALRARGSTGSGQ